MNRLPSLYRVSFGLIVLFLLWGTIANAQGSTSNYGGDQKFRPARKIKLYSSNPKLTRAATDWKAERFELIGGVGPSLFLGDLGGQDGPAQPSILDAEPLTVRYGASIGMRYFLREFHSVRGMASYGRVKGSDALTNYPNRRYRNLNFKSAIYELAGLYEFHILRPDFIHFAGARTTKVFSGARFGAYGFGGLALFAFNPKGEKDGEYYALAPLNTEGQGLENGPKDYKRISVSVPMGWGVYYLLNHNFKIGMEFGYRWSFTDYIDDASGYFYDNAIIEESNGETAAYFANPSVSLENVPDDHWYKKDQPRGGSKSNDTYMFTQLILSKTFGPSISNKPFKQKKRKKAKYKAGKKFTPFKILKGSNKSKTYKKSKKIKNKKRNFKAPKTRFGKRNKKKKGKMSF